MNPGFWRRWARRVRNRQRVGRSSKRLELRAGLLSLEPRCVPAGLLVTGSGAGVPSLVTVFDSATGQKEFSFTPYGSRFRGGVNVAVGDVTGDGVLDIVATAGPGGSGVVKVFSSVDGHDLGQFRARPRGYTDGLSVALGDVTGDGKDDIVVGTLNRRALVQVFEGTGGTRIGAFRADPGTGTGIQLAVGDLNRDGKAEIVSAPVRGGSYVTIRDGQTGRIVARKPTFGSASRGGISIAVGDVNADRTLDLIVAGSTATGAKVRLFSGSAAAPLATTTYVDAGLTRGVRVAAVDIGNLDTGDGIALAAARGHASAAVVLDTSFLRPIVPSRVAGSNPTRPVRVYALARVQGGSTVAAGNSVNLAAPAVAAVRYSAESSLLPYQRLGRFQYDPTTGAPEFVAVQPNDPALVGKDIVVLVHGWAAGYSYWVNAVAQNTNPNLPTTLLWWDTDPGQAGYNLAANQTANTQSDSLLGPASYFLLHGYDTNGVETSTTGLAQQVAARVGSLDPNTVVLAYSWIDDSGTSSSLNAYLSEAKTILNGERLADGLRTVLGDPSQFTGKIQLVGHSHGSKVATVAAVSLTTRGAPNTFPVRQLTILDSPEDQSVVSNELAATNFNWYYLQSLNISRTDASATFVDNYISYFDEPYAGITTPSGNRLSSVVDVQLDPSPFPVLDAHSYSAQWYNGSGNSTVNGGQSVGQMWSPMLPGNTGSTNPPATLTGGLYKQGWQTSGYAPSQQYVLQAGPSTARTYSSYAVAWNNLVNTASVVSKNTSPTGTGASVTLTQTSSVPLPTYQGSITTEYGRLNGISFDYSFAAGVPSATISVQIDGDLVFVIDSSVVAQNSSTDGTRSGVGTITLYQPEISLGGTHTLSISLSPDAGVTQARASLTNLNFFYAT